MLLLLSVRDISNALDLHFHPEEQIACLDSCPRRLWVVEETGVGLVHTRILSQILEVDRSLEDAVHTGPRRLHDPLEILQRSPCLHGDIARNYFPGFVDRSLPRDKQQFPELDSGRKWKTKRRGSSFHSFLLHEIQLVGMPHWCLRVENQPQFADQ